jgi:NAD(P)H dehydrogenase (quinone)
MTTNVLVAFYSTYGHVHRMALAVAKGAESVPEVTVRLCRIAELEEARKALSAQDAYVRAQQAQADIPVVTHDDLRWADGIAWGTPTRYGNMSAQMKQFVDSTGGLWLKGELEDKATGIFTSTATIHGGQETTILTALVPLIHLGMVFVGTPYGQNPGNRRHRRLAIWTRHPGRYRRLAAAGRSRTHNSTQPRQPPCSCRGSSQGPQGKQAGRARGLRECEPGCGSPPDKIGVVHHHLTSAPPIEMPAIQSGCMPVSASAS